jgi:hypothetical protein
MPNHLRIIQPSVLIIQDIPFHGFIADDLTSGKLDLGSK